MKVQISIRGRSYTVRSDDDEDPVSVAGVLDRRMAEISSRAPALDDYTVAILAALNLGSEHDRVRRALESELERVDHDLASALLLLGETSPP